MQSVPLVVPLLSRVARLALTHAGETGLKLRLTNAPISPSINTTLAALVAAEATFDQYVPGGYAVSWQTGMVDSNGNAFNLSLQINIIVSTIVIVNTIYNVWIDDGTKVIMVGLLPAPVAMTRVGANLEIQVADSYPPGLPAVVIFP